jgi:hypothetical protein
MKRRPFSKIAGVALAVWTTTPLADSTDARCDVYPRGSDHTDKMIPCVFSQRQGFVTIRRDDGVIHDHEAIERLRMPRALTSHLYPLLAPGTTMLITDAPVLEHTTGPALSVMRSGLPGGESTAAVQESRGRPGAAPVESRLIN